VACPPDYPFEPRSNAYLKAGTVQSCPVLSTWGYKVIERIAEQHFVHDGSRA
jgi:hypothetical protein